jgi:hypothetical protein
MSLGGATKKTFTRPIAQGVLEVAQRKAASQLNVFVAGPYVELSWTEQQRAGATNGAKLRLELLEAVTRMEHKFVLGEHRGVAEVTGDNIPTQASVALSELLLVESADAIIIVPDSPGSFCELGAWSLRDDLCPKILILGNADFQSGFSYVGHGVFPMAENLHATVRWVDYTDFSAVSEVVSAFLSGVQDRIISRMLRRGR